MSEPVQKVTAFITRESRGGTDLLLFKHPYAGIQIPAGTAEDDETPAEAVLREAAEETGLTDLSIRQFLGSAETKLAGGLRVIAQPTKVYARPDVTSFDWAYIRKGIGVVVKRRSDGFSQITYEEFDQEPNPQYLTMCITGWVPDEVLADATLRHFYHLEFSGQTEEQWMVHSDNHCFSLFWAPLTDLPEIIQPQDAWLSFLTKSDLYTRLDHVD
jgi:8-oxo-dGTP pyrophosphatase MutT (NUDIX family)